MDNQLDVVSQFEPDDLEEVACGIRADSEHFRGIRVGVEVDNSEGMLDCMSNSWLGEAVLERRPVEFHIALYRNTN